VTTSLRPRAPDTRGDGKPGPAGSQGKVLTILQEIRLIGWCVSSAVASWAMPTIPTAGLGRSSGIVLVVGM
jgi:hypothetical protein